MRPRKLEGGRAFTWRFKTRDYWEAVPASRPIESVEELMRLHGPWVTSDASQVLEVIRAHGARLFLDQEGLIVAEVDDSAVGELNADLAGLGCTLSEELLHTV